MRIILKNADFSANNIHTVVEPDTPVEPETYWDGSVTVSAYDGTVPEMTHTDPNTVENAYDGSVEVSGANGYTVTFNISTDSGIEMYSTPIYLIINSESAEVINLTLSSTSLPKFSDGTSSKVLNNVKSFYLSTTLNGENPLQLTSYAIDGVWYTFSNSASPVEITKNCTVEIRIPVLD